VISYNVACDQEHRFEAWFRNAGAYDTQVQNGLLECPVCGSTHVQKALMAPAVAARKPNRVSLSTGHPEHARIRKAMRKLRDKVTSEAEYVGEKFADEARKIHLNETPARGIYGEATSDEARALSEDGIDFMPLPNLPEEHN